MTEETPLQILERLYDASTQELGDWVVKARILMDEEGSPFEAQYQEVYGLRGEVFCSPADAQWIVESRRHFPALKEQMERVEDRPSLGDRWTIEWSTRAEKAEAEVKRLREALSKYESLPDYHVTEYTLSGWSVEHPLACRDSGSLQDCFVHKAVAVENADLSEPPLPPGRYRTWLGDSVEYEVLAESQEAEG